MKTTYFLLFLLCFSLSAIGQGVDSTFQYSTDLGGSEAAIGIVESPNGFKVVGFGSRFDTTFRSGLWIGDLSFSFTLDHTQWHGREGEAWASGTNTDLLRTPKGEYVYAGGTIDTNQLWAPLVIGFDSLNQETWRSTFPRPDSNATIRAGMILPDSGFLFLGRTSKSSTGLNDFYLLRLDQDRNQIMERTYGGTFDERGGGPSLVRRKNGYALSGYTDSFSPSAHGGRDGWLIYTNFEGQFLREKFFGTQGDDGWIQIALAPDSLSLYLVQGIDTLLQPGFSPRAYQVMKLDPNGNPEWRLILQDSLSRYAYGIYTLANGDLLVYGILDIFHSPPSDYGWLARISAQGDLLWERAYQYSDDEFPQKISLSNWILDVLEVENGNILFVGSTTLRSEFGGQNPWVAQVDSNGCFSTHCDSLPAPFTGPPAALEAEPEQLVRMFPNPAQDHLIIQIAAPQLPASFTLLDVQGRTVSQQVLTQPQSKLDVSSFPPGLYVGKLISNQGEVVQQKVVISK